MAGATRDLNLSFQAAETALRAAENDIESQTYESYFETTENGIYSQTDAEAESVDLFIADWDDDDSIAMFPDGVEMLEGVSLSPRYMIKQFTRIEGNNLTITGYADTPPVPVVFRVTARGTGGTNNRATLLRSHYAKGF